MQDVEIISFYVEASPQAEPQPAPEQSGGQANTAAGLLESMTLEEKVAQMFIVRCPESNAVQVAQEYQVGGYILFARDFGSYSRDQVQSHIQNYQKAAKIPMIIGVDEEGGTVNRVSLYKEKADLLSSLGINLNFAPVADVALDPGDFMYDRSFGVSPQAAAEYVHTVVTVNEQNNMGSVLKHFPGYGNNVDTHTGIAVDKRSLESFRENDFLPFKSGIEAGAPVVLVAHNIVNCMDAERPASLSAAAHNILRSELGFEGLIITDDFSMGAIKSGKISKKRIDESVLRILQYKIDAGLIK